MMKQTLNHNPDMCKKIISYLSSRQHKEDNLNGIMMALFAREINALSKQILVNLNYLISTNRVFVEYDSRGNKVFRLFDKQ